VTAGEREIRVHPVVVARAMAVGSAARSWKHARPMPADKPSIFPARPLQLTHLLYGGDYNPDQWPDAVQEDDPRLMKLAHWNIATVPVFSWVHLNPAEGVYDFEWLDRVVARLTEAGIDLCMATATASTPAWVDQQYPDALTVDEQGRKRPHGNRHAFCPNSPSYRRLAGALVREMASRYQRHPGLKLWHVNNEYGGNWPNYCYCERCADGFRAFLERRYGSLDALNTAWSTAFWGHTYSSFSQIDPPFAHGEGSIQTMKIDWRRFQSASYLACFEHEAQILREVTPAIPVTTNLMGPFFALNYHEWAKAMDVVSWDNYPRPETPYSEVAFNHSLHRGMRGGQPFLLLEQSPSHQNWATYCRLRPPGQLRLLSYQAVAHGAESVMYFQWRKSRGGIEKLHGAVVEHHGRTDARVFREVSSLGKELASLGTKTLGGRTPARVAIVFDWECWWAQHASSGPSRDFNYHPEVLHHHAAFHQAGIPIDVVGPDADLHSYDVIVLAVAYLLRPAQARAIADRVRAGATLIATFFSGMVDEDDRVHEGGAPGPLRDVLGVTVEEYDAFSPDVKQGVRFDGPIGNVAPGVDYGASVLCERLWLTTAKPLAHYTHEFYAGDTAITVNSYGKGKAYYVGTHLEAPALSALFAAIAAELGIASPLRDGAAPPVGVEVTLRVSPSGQRLLYILNHDAAEPRTVALPPGSYTDALSDRTFEGTATLGPRDVVILDAKR
jgi:beta-galactosidase